MTSLENGFCPSGRGLTPATEFQVFIYQKKESEIDHAKS